MHYSNRQQQLESALGTAATPSIESAGQGDHQPNSPSMRSTSSNSSYNYHHHHHLFNSSSSSSSIFNRQSTRASSSYSPFFHQYSRSNTPAYHHPSPQPNHRTQTNPILNSRQPPPTTPTPPPPHPPPRPEQTPPQHHHQQQQQQQQQQQHHHHHHHHHQQQQQQQPIPNPSHHHPRLHHPSIHPIPSSHHPHHPLNQFHSDWSDRPYGSSRSSSSLSHHTSTLPPTTTTTTTTTTTSLPHRYHPSPSSNPIHHPRPRQWGWTGVEIPIHHVHQLSHQIERSSTPSTSDNLLDPNLNLDPAHHPPDPLPPSSAAAAADRASDPIDNLGSGEVLSCNFGGDRWKVEIVKAHTLRRPSAPSTPTTTTHPINSKPTEDHPNHLSLYLTCHELEVDWPTSRSIPTSILISIKEPRIPIHLNPITDLGSASEGWIWSSSSIEHRFEREREVWECHRFPSLSSLLQNPRVAMFDSFILTIQIGTPSAVSIPQLPQATYVPNSILESLESLLDDPNTSDLQIIVTEVQEPDESEISMATATATAIQSIESVDQSLSIPTTAPALASTKFRKRIIYAHSSILQHRSDYFKTMLADEAQGGGWAESGSQSNQSCCARAQFETSRRLGLIKIEDFDFISVYWLLRWLYSNRIFFADHEDVRAQCHLGALLGSYDSCEHGIMDTTLRSRSHDEDAHDPWSWRTYGMMTRESSEDNTKADESVLSDQAIDIFETVSESGLHENSIVSGTPRIAMSSLTSTNPSRHKTRSSHPTPSTSTSTTKRRSVGQVQPGGLTSLTGTTTNRTHRAINPSSSTKPSNSSHTTPHHARHDQRDLSMPTFPDRFVPSSSNPASSTTPLSSPPQLKKIESPNDAHPSATIHETSSSLKTSSSNWLTGDPHPHPTKMTTRASAFSIYRLSHRYELKTLQELALTHLISNLNPASAFPMLLASYVFPDLHDHVKAYCLAHYFEILKEPEFSRCYAEVGEGLWEHGGEVLLAFTMSLMPGPHHPTTS